MLWNSVFTNVRCHLDRQGPLCNRWVRAIDTLDCVELQRAIIWG